MDPSSKEKSSQAVSSVDSGAAKSLSSVTNITERTMKLPHGYPSLSRYHSNFSRSMFWRRARQRYRNQYSRRVSSSSIDILSSLRKTVAPLYDERLSIKLNSHYNSESGYHEESREKAFFRPQRIRSNALVMESVSSDVANMVCGICSKPLKLKLSSNLCNTMSTIELSIIGILACGHAYHADCLEERTSEADRRDPPCPMCVSMPLKLDAL